VQTDLTLPATPKTQAATFTITPRDVGSEAVRPGHMADVELQRRALLLACKAVQGRIKAGLQMSAALEYMLDVAIRGCE
jgi:hypothetical protein